jgi:flavorubredoxin
MTQTTEIAPDIFRISTYFPDWKLQFNQFLVRDEEPLLYHTGMRGLFPAVREAVASLVDPGKIRWIGFSHFEADECGALREWQELAPESTAVCSYVAKNVSADDVVAARPCRALEDGEVVTTGKKSFRFLRTPQVPHAWDAGHLFEETTGTFLCSDLFHQSGEVEDITEDDVAARFKETLIQYQQGPLADYLPYTPITGPTLERLAALKPKVLAPMHGSAWAGDGEKAIRDLAAVMKDVLGR